MAAVRLPDALGFEMAAEGRLDFFAVRPFFDEVTGWMEIVGDGLRLRQWRTAGLCAINAGDAFSQVRELLLDVHYVRLFFALVYTGRVGVCQWEEDDCVRAGE